MVEGAWTRSTVPTVSANAFRLIARVEKWLDTWQRYGHVVQ